MFAGMKSNGHSLKQNGKPRRVTSPAKAEGFNSFEFSPSADEVATRAYFNYEQQGSPQGQDVQHWLEAESQLLAEYKHAEVHAFHRQAQQAFSNYREPINL